MGGLQTTLMIIIKNFLGLFSCFIVGYLLCFPVFADAKEPSEIFTLKQTIENAIKANLGLKSSREEIKAALSAQKVQRANFLPTLSASYRYTRKDEGPSIGGITNASEDQYAFVTTFTQPVFTGFSHFNRYKIASLGLNVSRFNEKLFRQDVVFAAKRIYFELLKARKLLTISQQTVTQITAHKEVAKNYYQVGMTPLNDFLQAQVELANARQELIVAENSLETVKSNFNILLRRPINALVEIKDILSYSPFEHDIDYCLDIAEKTRLEIKIADLEVKIGEKEVILGQKDYYPSINLEGNYFQYGTDWDINGGEGIYDPSGWNITAVASWNFWEWGRSYYGTKEKLSRLSQARYRKEEIHDSISLEVKKAYLKTKESEENIITVKKAIEQAKENFRINEERYKEQMSTSTDVLDAQTLLSRTMSNYYNALYDFKISKAALHRTMGQGPGSIK